MANDDHVAQIMKGATAWNAWREENPKISPDLTEARLVGADLTGAVLSAADLGGADLSRANLFEANLTGADLIEADVAPKL